MSDSVDEPWFESSTFAPTALADEHRWATTPSQSCIIHRCMVPQTLQELAPLVRLMNFDEKDDTLMVRRCPNALSQVKMQLDHLEYIQSPMHAPSESNRRGFMANIRTKLDGYMKSFKSQSGSCDALVTWHEARLQVIRHVTERVLQANPSAADAELLELQHWLVHECDAFRPTTDTDTFFAQNDDASDEYHEEKGNGDDPRQYCDGWLVYGHFYATVHTSGAVARLLARAVQTFEFPTHLHFLNFLSSVSHAAIDIRQTRELNDASFRYSIENNRRAYFKSATRWEREYATLVAHNRYLAARMARVTSHIRRLETHTS